MDIIILFFFLAGEVSCKFNTAEVLYLIVLSSFPK